MHTQLDTCYACIKSLSIIAFLLLGNVCAQEEPVAKHPTQKELADVIESTDRMVITEPLKDVPIFELVHEGIGREFLAQFAIDEKADGFHCMCYGEAWISFYLAGKKTAQIGFHHAHSIRWIDGPWQSDAVLTGNGGGALSKWFATKGFPGFENARLAAIAVVAAEEKKQAGFNAQLPSEVLKQLQAAGGGFEREHTFARRALASAADRAQLAASVFRAFGQLPLKRTGYDSAMSVAEKIIELSDGNDLARALELVEADQGGLQGAAFLFCRTLYLERLPLRMAETWGPKLATVVLNSPEDSLKPDAIYRLLSISGEGISNFLVGIASRKTAFPYTAHFQPNDYDYEPELVSAACLALAMRHHPQAAQFTRIEIAKTPNRPSRIALEVAMTLSTGAPTLNPEAFKLLSYVVGFGALQVIEETPPDLIPAKLLGAALNASAGRVREAAERLAFKLGVGPAKEPEEQNYREIEYDKGLAGENPVEAITVYSEQLKIARGTTKGDLLRLRGGAYALLGRNEEALADFQTSRKLDPRQGETSRMIATTLWQLGRGEEAVASLSRQFPLRDPWDLEVRGVAHLSLGNYKKAEQDLSASVIVYPQELYRLFFQHLAARLSGHPEFSRLASNREDALFDPQDEADQWTQKIADYLLGKISRDKLIQATQAGSPERRVSREAEALYYIAQELRVAGDLKGEKDQLMRCVALNQFQLTEHWLAAVRLAKSDSR